MSKICSQRILEKTDPSQPRERRAKRAIEEEIKKKKANKKQERQNEKQEMFLMNGRE